MTRNRRGYRDDTCVRIDEIKASRQLGRVNVSDVEGWIEGHSICPRGGGVGVTQGQNRKKLNQTKMRHQIRKRCEENMCATFDDAYARTLRILDDGLHQTASCARSSQKSGETGRRDCPWPCASPDGGAPFSIKQSLITIAR